MAITERYTTGGTTIYGLSTDTKPTVLTSISGNIEVPNASVFYEMDTKKIYMYDTENNRWIEQ